MALGNVVTVVNGKSSGETHEKSPRAKHYEEDRVFDAPHKFVLTGEERTNEEFN